MFKRKNRLPLFGFLLSAIVLLCWYNNVVAHPTSNDRHSNLHGEEVIAQQNFEEVEIKTTQVRDNIYMVVGDGGNIAVSTGTDGVFMVDSQFAPLSTKITKAVAGISSEPIRYLINTHYHFDHTDGNANFAKAGAIVIAHDNVPQQMKVPHNYEVLGMEREPASVEALPQLTFSNNFRLALNGNYIHAFAVSPAHTDGDVVINFTKENVIHTGDLFFNGFYPFIDTGVGGSVNGMVKGIDRILRLADDDTLIIPGHGQLATKKDLVVFQEMLKTVNDRLQTAIEQKMSLEQIIDAKLLADLDDTWGKGFLSSDQFITIAYNGMINTQIGDKE